ncbi:sphingomyelin phosphodiesterase [Bacterioplanoides sp.]|uniref:sphingomyelin phosphodiesterase n=1 Tax=Bacterioplanoides sp. TaxID=2066072 RepID=UPI003B5CE286
MLPFKNRLSTIVLAASISASSFAMSNAPVPAAQDTQPPAQPTDVAPVSGLSYADDLKLLAYNVYMLPRAISDWSPDARAQLLLQSDVFNGHDVVILDEVFDNTASTTLLNGLKNKYPHQTEVLGRSQNGWDQTQGSYTSTTIEDGGVAVISRWPIEEKVQYVFKDSCGFDATSNKGFVYAKVNKNGAIYHVIGTHVQAVDSMCNGGSAAIRKKQFAEMQQFIASKNIPADEVVFMGGDFNVIKGSDEYADMLETLKASQPDSYAGFDSTWDPKTNGIAAYNYPDLHSEYLDYIFVSRDHAQPTYWHNQALDVTTSRWQDDNHQYQELSDHYPIAAFSYADKNTRTESYRDVNTPYSQVRFRNEANGAYIKIDTGDSSGWMTINGSANDPATSFNLDNWFPKNRAFCIRNDDFVQVQGNARAGSYWNWWLGGGSGNYAYYTKNNDASNKLRIRILNDDGDCLKNGDKVAFVDRSTVNGTDYYVQRWPSGSWKDYMFMWSGSVGANETFTVEMGEGQKQDWSSKLRYLP